MNSSESENRIFSQFDLLLALAISVASLIVFALRAAPGVLPGDSGEFQFVPYVWGVAHPTGYPLYTILGGVWSHALPLGSVARRMNLFSALWGAVAAGEVYLLTALLAQIDLGDAAAGRKNLWMAAGGLAAVYVVFFSPVFQRESMVAEVYTMHAAILGALLIFSVAWLERGDGRFAFWSMLFLGLGLAHHRTVLLLLPGLVLAALIAFLRSLKKPPIRRWLWPAIAFLAPLSLYLYIPLRAPHLSYFKVDLGEAGSWSLYDPTVAGFLRFVSGARFSGNLLSPAQALERIPSAWKILTAQVGIGGLILACAGALLLLARRKWATASILLIGLAALLGFDLFYGIGDIRDFYGPPMVFLAAIVGYGVYRAASVPVKAWLRVLSVVAAATVLVAFHPPSMLDYHTSDQTARRWEKLLSLPLPEDSIVVTNDRDEMVPLYYYQLVEHRRTGWQPLYPLIIPSTEWDDVAKVFRKALSSGRTVYTIKKMPQMRVEFDMVDGPDGTQQVQPMHLPQTMTKVGVDFGNVLRLVGVDVRSKEGKLHVAAYWRAVGKMEPKAVAYIHLLDQKGEKVSQGQDYVPGYPYYPPEMWNRGETVRVSQEIPLDGVSNCGFLLMGWYTKAHQLGKPIEVKLNGGELCRRR